MPTSPLFVLCVIFILSSERHWQSAPVIKYVQILAHFIQVQDTIVSHAEKPFHPSSRDEDVLKRACSLRFHLLTQLAAPHWDNGLKRWSYQRFNFTVKQPSIYWKRFAPALYCGNSQGKWPAPIAAPLTTKPFRHWASVSYPGTPRHAEEPPAKF